MVRAFRTAIFLIAIICAIDGNAYSIENSAKGAATSDGVEYVYVSLNPDMQSYQVTSNDGGESKVVSPEKADQNKTKADMLSYQVMSKDGADGRQSYYQSIREKILARLKRNYTSHYNDGDVHLFFVLDKKGTIIRIDVALNRSTKDAKLVDIALLSLQQAAPFGPFPKDQKAPQILFSLIVSFKKDNR